MVSIAYKKTIIRHNMSMALLSPQASGCPLGPKFCGTEAGSWGYFQAISPKKVITPITQLASRKRSNHVNGISKTGLCIIKT
jgi:hypothetical protein